MVRIPIYLLLIFISIETCAQSKLSNKNLIESLSFSGIKLGDKKSKISNLIYVGQNPAVNHRIDWYIKTDDQLKIGNCSLDTIKYGFHKNKLYQVYAKFSETDCVYAVFNSFAGKRLEGYGQYSIFPSTSGGLTENPSSNKEKLVIILSNDETELILKPEASPLKEFRYSKVFLWKKTEKAHDKGSKKYKRWKKRQDKDPIGSDQKALQEIEKKQKKLERKEKSKEKTNSF